MAIGGAVRVAIGDSGRLTGGDRLVGTGMRPFHNGLNLNQISKSMVCCGCQKGIYEHPTPSTEFHCDARLREVRNRMNKWLKRLFTLLMLVLRINWRLWISQFCFELITMTIDANLYITLRASFAWQGLNGAKSATCLDYRALMDCR